MSVDSASTTSEEARLERGAASASASDLPSEGQGQEEDANRPSELISTVTFTSVVPNFQSLRDIQRVECTPDAYTTQEVQFMPVPPNIKSTLKPHQHAAFHWLSQPPHKKILADDFGLGKTRAALAYICSLPPMGTGEGIGAVVVVPKTLIKEWELEILNTVDAKAISLLVVDSPAGLDRKTLLDLRRFDIVLTTPYMVHQQMTAYERSLKSRSVAQFYGWPLIGASVDSTGGDLNKWQCVMLDEAHLIRNNGKMALSIRKLRGTHRVALTGAPVQNSIDDLDSLLEFVSGQIKVGQSEKQSPTEMKKRRTNCKALQQVTLLRRTRDTLVNGQPIMTTGRKIVMHHHIEFSEPERRIYHLVLTSFPRNWIRTTRAMDTSHLLEAILQTGGNIDPIRFTSCDASLLIRLRQACCDPHILPLKPKTSDKAASDGPPRKRLRGADGLPKPKVRSLGALRNFLSKISHEQAPSKVLAMIQLMKEARERDPACRFLVFSDFKGMLDQTRGHLQRAGFHFVMCDSGLGFVRKNMSEFALKSPDKCDGMLSTMGSGGLGLSLIDATVVFFLNPAWVPARHRQAEARTFQMGQAKDVYVHYLIIDKRKTYKCGEPIEPTMEALVMDIQKRKTGREVAAYGNPTRDLERWRRQAMEARALTQKDLRNIFHGEDHEHNPDSDADNSLEDDHADNERGHEWEDQGEEADEM